MRLFFVLTLVLAAIPVVADTLTERVTALTNASGVLAVQQQGDPEQVISGIHLAKVTYWAVEGDAVKANTVGLIITDYQGQSEAAYWLNRTPSVLVPAPEAPTYITDRNTPFTAAQVEAFCNSLWQIANPTAGPILNFTVTAINGKTIRVAGDFDIAANTREHREYYIWLVDANGSVTPGNANVKFERIT